MGINAGNAAADAMIAARQGDGRFGPSQWNQQVGAGFWQPLLDPVTGLPQLDPTRGRRPLRRDKQPLRR
jgi:hypothetical protein